MTEENKPANDQEQEKEDLLHEMELGRSGGFVLRVGGVLFGLCIALAGWFLSQELGRGFLVAGLVLGALFGGLVFLTGSLVGVILRKRDKDLKNKF